MLGTKTEDTIIQHKHP